jgi:hypothetical protein
MENNNGLGPDDVKNVLNNVNFSDVIDKLTNNSDETANLISQSAEHMTPEMLEQARRYANGDQGQKIKEEMMRKGANTKEMKDKMELQKKLYNDAHNKAKGEIKKAILITSAKRMESKNIHPKILDSEVKKIIGTNAIEISCSRLATDSLRGKTIKAWYDPTRNVKYPNKRASAIIGFPISGELLIVMEGEDLLTEDLLKIEKSLK